MGECRARLDTSSLPHLLTPLDGSVLRARTPARLCACVSLSTCSCVMWQTEVYRRRHVCVCVCVCVRARVYREVHEMADGGVVGARVHVDPLQPYHQLPHLSPNVTTLHLRVTS
jgi:hypothetical protein